MQAVIYARVSSTDDSQSYERQINDLKRFAEFKNLTVANTFAEKISGYKASLDARTEFNQMLIYIQDNNIQNILVSELSRISRRYIDTINFINDCSQKGINIHILKEGLSTLNEDGTENSTVQMLVGMLSSMAQQESQSLSYRIKSGKAFAASKGLGLRVPYGYMKDDDGFPIVDPDKEELVLKMFELMLEGFGTRKIATYLNENYDTKKWTNSSVYSIVTNSFYKGIPNNNESVLDVVKIVSDEVFDKTQDFIKSRKRFAGGQDTNINPFASFIKCECGSTMNQIVIKKNNTDIYRCASKCGVKSVNRPFLINEVRIVLERNAKKSKEEAVRERMNNSAEVLKAELKQSERLLHKLSNMIDMNYEKYLSQEIDEKQYNRFKGRLTTQLENTSTKTEKDRNALRNVLNALKNDVTHYSTDLSIFKKQLLKDLEYIMIREDIAVVKIKAWGRQIIVLYRGQKLRAYLNSIS